MLAAPELRDAFDLFLQNDLEKKLLRFTTAGSVDDGKSTLIGRLLHDAKGVYEDQLASVKKSRINRSTGPLDFSLLTDGLRAEREQGITIDVAYRYFQTERRKFIIADTPGHEQYTRNMATGASTAHLALILVDGTKGLLPQTRRHSYIASLLGIPNVLAVINKMDLMDYREDVFLRLQDDFLYLAAQLKIPAVRCVPVSALEGDNVVSPSGKMPWYSGPTLLEHLETISICPSADNADARFPVQYVIRPDSTFRGFAGQVASGILRPGDSLMALPSRQVTRVKSIVTYDGEQTAAVRSQSVTLTLEDEIDLSRGDMLVAPENPPTISRRFLSSLVWLCEKPLELNRTYLAKHTTRQVKAKVVRIRHRVNVNSLAQEPANELEMNGIALVEIETSSALFFDSYERSRATGSFILIDPISNATSGAGMIREALEGDRTGSGHGTHPLTSECKVVGAPERVARHGYRPAIFVLPKNDSFAQIVDHALFDAGMETVVFHEPETLFSSGAAVLKALWLAGIVMILVVGDISVETRAALKSIAGSSVFDFSRANAQNQSNEAIAQILRCAGSLWVDAASSELGRDYQDVD
jgi:sulfate adenylyltransferase subunit 1